MVRVARVLAPGHVRRVGINAAARCKHGAPLQLVCHVPGRHERAAECCCPLQRLLLPLCSAPHAPLPAHLKQQGREGAEGQVWAEAACGRKAVAQGNGSVQRTVKLWVVGCGL